MTAVRRSSRPKHNRLQAFFVRGLITVLPVLFTVFILLTAFRFVDGYVTGPVNSVLYWALERNGAGWKVLELLGIDPHAEIYLAQQFPRRLEERLARDQLTGYDSRYYEVIEAWRQENERFIKNLEELAIDERKLHASVIKRIPPLVGLVASVLLVLTLGSLAGGFLGRTILQRGDRAMLKIPLVRSIYPYTKQLVDFFLAERSIEFDTVVAVPYPRRGLYSMGFATGSALRTLRAASGKNLVTVFIPSSPMPMTGYTAFVPAEDLVPLPLTVDEALRTIVSGGVLVPPHERVDQTAAESLAKAHGEFPRGPASQPDSRLET